MMIAKDINSQSPEDVTMLLSEAVSFTREILMDLASAPLVTFEERFSQRYSYEKMLERCSKPDKVLVASIECVAGYYRKESDDPVCLYRPTDYSCSNLYIREAFQTAVAELLEERGLKRGTRRNMKPGDFAISSIVGATNVNSISLYFYRCAENAQAILHDIACTDLNGVCLKGLQQSIKNTQEALRPHGILSGSSSDKTLEPMATPVTRPAPP
ncbi:MAG: hypothetical protein NDJ24_10670 [Alphaproteobacteria bacterium]|nr:hypothetical protein [Alphaproteobacteria bacterium]